MLLETHSFEFGEFLLDTKEKVLLRHGKPVPVTPRIFQLLLVLVENHGHIVEKDTLMETVWTDSFVEESNLTFSIRQIRKILGDSIRNPRFIETVRGRGYRFFAKVREISGRDVLIENDHLSETVSERFPFFNFWKPRPVLFAIFGLTTILFLVSAGFFFWRESSNLENKAMAINDPDLKFETVVRSNQAGVAAISPDGKYIAYSNTSGGQQSLWLRQLSSGINTQIVSPPDDVRFMGIEFSPDSEQIYFVSVKAGQPPRLDRVSILGGAVQTDVLGKSQNLEELQGWFSLSPDNSKISFLVNREHKSNLMIGGTDGSDIRTLFVTPKNHTITGNAFSPNGKKIAFASGQSDTGEQAFGVYTINLENGEVAPVTPFNWFHVRGLIWLPDQRGLLVTARTRNYEPQQLWKISLPGGEVKKITDTQFKYNSISAAADLSLILLTQVSPTSYLYLAPFSTPEEFRPIAQAFEGVDWTEQNDLVFHTHSKGNNDIWLYEPETASQKQITMDPATDINPVVSPDGRFIVFISDRNGKNNLWRMNADGSHPVQITDGEGEQFPVFTPDGKFVVFNSMNDVSLWKVSIEGGEPVQIFGKRAFKVSISPDGKSFAHFTKDAEKLKIVVRSFDGGILQQEFAIPEGFVPGRDIVWTRNGNILIYNLEDINLVGNLWQQKLNGESPRKLTNYTSEEIFGFDLSPDGSQIALIRGSWRHDLVLVSGLN